MSVKCQKDIKTIRFDTCKFCSNVESENVQHMLSPENFKTMPSIFERNEFAAMRWNLFQGDLPFPSSHWTWKTSCRCYTSAGRLSVNNSPVFLSKTPGEKTHYQSSSSASSNKSRTPALGSYEIRNTWKHALLSKSVAGDFRLIYNPLICMPFTILMLTNWIVQASSMHLRNIQNIRRQNHT